MAIEHKTFVVERMLAASPKHAFRFFSEPALKERWTGCHPDWTVLEERFDFQIGGVEAKRWRMTNGQEQTFLAHYLDIVPARRIIYAFDMTSAGERVSASLATVELMAEGAGTRMVFTSRWPISAMRPRCASALPVPATVWTGWSISSPWMSPACIEQHGVAEIDRR